MERVTDLRSSFFTNLLDNYSTVSSQPTFKVYPQMPLNQIKHYVKQAAHKHKQVIVQLYIDDSSKKISEVTGTIKLSHRSSHVILTADDQQTVHLLQPQYIRHLRAA